MLIIIVSVATLLHCQNTICGKVVDSETGYALPFANIQIGTSTRGSITNDAGEFRIQDIIFPVELKVSYMGYETSNVNFRSSDNCDIVVKLKPSQLLLLDLC
jgi:carboxypeptidase-like protein